MCSVMCWLPTFRMRPTDPVVPTFVTRPEYKARNQNIAGGNRTYTPAPQRHRASASIQCAVAASRRLADPARSCRRREVALRRGWHYSLCRALPVSLAQHRQTLHWRSTPRAYRAAQRSDGSGRTQCCQISRPQSCLLRKLSTRETTFCLVGRRRYHPPHTSVSWAIVAYLSGNTALD